MTYSIRYRGETSGIENQHWTASLFEAKRHASEVVASGSAEQAEVLNGVGKVVYRFPEPEHD
jgi:hypothetical protein